MKRQQTLLTSIILLIGILSTKPVLGQKPEALTPGYALDTIYDMFGNKKQLRDIMFDYDLTASKLLPATTSASTSCGFFNVYFASNSGMENSGNSTHTQRRAVICQVLSDISAFIVSPLNSTGAKVNLLIDAETTASAIGAAGVATSYYAHASSPQSTNPGIADGEIWKTIHSGVDSYTNVASPVNLSINGFYHGMMAFDFGGYNWDLTLTTAPSGSELDLYTVALHEITHALGFASLISSTGVSKYGAVSNYYSRYDLFLKNKTGLSLLTNSGACSPVYGQTFNSSVSTSELQPSVATCTNDVYFDGTVNQKCYTPSAFTNGSSLSHFEDICQSPTGYTNGTYYVMNASTPNGVHKRFLKPEERKALCDMGYKTNTTYGTLANLTYTTYSGSCPGIEVAGINDGILAGTYIYTATSTSSTSATSITIPLSSLVSNDYAVATPITPSCIEVVYASGSVSIVSTNVVFTSNTGYTGPVILRYVPKDANNVSGNITYVYGFIYPSGCSPVSPCDMVQNGGFENVSSSAHCGNLGANVDVNCWYAYKDSPDIFTRGCTAGTNGYNLGTNTFSTSPPWDSRNGSPNNSVLGLYEGFVGGGSYNEAVQNYLGAPLTNGTVYTLSYWYFNFSGVLRYPNTSTSSSSFTVNATSDASPVILTFATLPGIVPAVASVYPGTLSTVLSHTLAGAYNTWIKVSTTFTYTGVNRSVLAFGLDLDANRAAGYGYTATDTIHDKNFYVLIDDVSLLPAGITPTLTIPSFVCSGNGLTNLGQYANPGGGVFTGAGVTYTAGNYNFNSPATLSPGTYTVTYTYTNSIPCSYSEEAYITVTPPVTVSVNSNTTICSGRSANLSASGATSYTWNPGAVTGASISVSPTVTTIYTVTGSNGGCSNTNTVSVNVLPNAPVLSASHLAIGTCSTTSTTLTVTGASTYTWMPGSIASSSIVVSPTVVTVYSVSGNYSLTGCGTGSTTVMVNPNTSTLCCSAASLTIGTSLTSSVNMASGNYTVSGTVIDMKGVITFTGNTSFSGYTLRMAPRTKLIVNSDYILSFTNCKLFSCSELWDGIYLSENVTKIGNVTFSLTTVEDMYNGVVLDGNNITIPTGTVTLGHITLDQSTFNKNYVGIQYKNASGVSTGLPYNLSLKTSTISSNASTTSPGSTLKPSNTYTYAYNNITNGTTGNSAPYVSFPRSFIGIYLNRLGTTSEIKIGDNSNSSYTNTFDNMDFGIYGDNVRLDVSNNYFKNITGSYKSEDISHGGGFPATGPEEIGIAVFVNHNTANTYSLTVGNGTVVPTSNPYPKGNKFEDCNKGVKSNKASTTYVSGNLFTSASTDIPVVTTSGVPPVIINNPNTYYFYKAQNAAWYTAFEGSARFYWNYVRNHNVGAYAAVSTGSVQIAVENNDIASPSSTGYCKNAVQLVQTGGTLVQAAVKNNTIVSVYNGVTANSLLSGLLVANNTFTIETTAKTYNHSATSRRTGVTLNYCEYANVQGNSISGNGSVPTSTTTAQYLNGVYLTHSKFGKVECNSTTALGRDFVFEGTCNNSWKVNNMSNSYTGLEIRTNGVIDNQGALTYTGTPNLSANTWTTITRQTNVVSSPSVNVTSKLFLLSGATTQPTLNFASGSGTNPYSTGFGGINVTTGTSYTCNAGSAQRVGDGNGGSNKKTTQDVDSFALFTTLAINDETAYEVFPDEFEHYNKQMVYTLIKQDSIHALSGSVLDSFYAQNQNSVINQFTEVREAINHNDIGSAIIKNASTSASNPIEQKHQRVNELVLKYLSDHSYQFTPIEKQDLYSMANECLVKGYYVMQCRNVLSAITGVNDVYTDNCDEEALASRKANNIGNTSQTSFNLSPNPNSGTMQLDYDLGGYTNAMVSLYDVAGKLIKSYKLDNTKGILQMDEQKLQNGIYFYRILVKDKVIKTDKIVIIK